MVLEVLPAEAPNDFDFDLEDNLDRLSLLLLGLLFRLLSGFDRLVVVVVVVVVVEVVDVLGVVRGVVDFRASFGHETVVVTVVVEVEGDGDLVRILENKAPVDLREIRFHQGRDFKVLVSGLFRTNGDKVEVTTTTLGVVLNVVVEVVVLLVVVLVVVVVVFVVVVVVVIV